MIADLKTLLDTVDRLRAQHRAGINPHFGQLDELFESAAAVRQGIGVLESRADAGAADGAAVRARITLELSPGARAVVESIAA